MTDPTMTDPTMTEPLYDPALLPAADESERCAPHAQRLGVDPGGTALWVDELIVVDVPLPWPKPVWAKDGFTAVPELVMEAGDAGRRVRVLAAVPLADGISRVVTHQLSGDSTFARAEHHVGAGDVVGLLARLLADGLDVSPATVAASEPVREFLLCTQGSHDMCCGSRGPKLKNELEARDPGVRVRRVSHTGGHRMAPTGVTLPDGRMWGFVDGDEMTDILERSGSPAALAPHCRGWIGAPAGPGQMAERAVFEAIDDWSFDDSARVVAIGDTTDIDNGTTRVEVTMIAVTTVEGTWKVEVAPGRIVPTIACGAPGGLPAKPNTEWVVVSISAPAP